MNNVFFIGETVTSTPNTNDIQSTRVRGTYKCDNSDSHAVECVH